MHAKAGDRILIMGHKVNEPMRDGEILEVVGEGGDPPYRVRWSDSDHETLVFPGPDAHIERAHHRSGKTHQ